VAPFSRMLLVFLPLAAATFGAFWLGVVPQTFSPLSPLSLEERDQWQRCAELPCCANPC
jgi:hypothetical protein